MKNNPKVLVVIVNWNGKALLRECLNSIKETEYADFDVLVVDNGSDDGSVDMIRRQFPWVDLIANKANLGFARANNLGIKRALKNGADYVFWLNNDTKIIHKDWLKNLVHVAESDARIGIVGCKLVLPSGKVQHAGGYLDYKGYHHFLDRDKIARVDYVTGAAFLIKREVIAKIGLVDEHFSPLYFEETDYCVRARAVGYWTVYTPRTVIIHVAGAASKTKSWFTPIMYRNAFRFYMLNYPLSWIMSATFFMLFSSFFERKDQRYKIGLRNIKLKEDWTSRIEALVNAYIVGMTAIPEILHKRHNRKERIWN